MMAPTKSHKSFNGNLLDAFLIGVAGTDAVSIHANMTSCVNVLVVIPLAHVLLDGGSYMSWVTYFGLSGCLSHYCLLLGV